MEPDAVVTVLAVAPAEALETNVAGAVDAAEPVRERGPILHRPELGHEYGLSYGFRGRVTGPVISKSADSCAAGLAALTISRFGAGNGACGSMVAVVVVEPIPGCPPAVRSFVLSSLLEPQARACNQCPPAGCGV